jgi:hypothetical protein
VEEGIMHNWYEMYVLGREKTSDLARNSESTRVASGAHGSMAKSPEPSRVSQGAGSTAATTVVLQRHEVISIPARRRPYRVTCIAGRLWTTMDACPLDTVLLAGESVTYRDRGRIVIQAMRTATVRIECPSAARALVGSLLRFVFRPASSAYRPVVVAIRLTSL